MISNVRFSLCAFYIGMKNDLESNSVHHQLLSAIAFSIIDYFGLLVNMSYTYINWIIIQLWLHWLEKDKEMDCIPYQFIFRPTQLHEIDYRNSWLLELHPVPIFPLPLNGKYFWRNEYEWELHWIAGLFSSLEHIALKWTSETDFKRLKIWFYLFLRFPYHLVECT